MENKITTGNHHHGMIQQAMMMIKIHQTIQPNILYLLQVLSETSTYHLQS